LEDLDCPLLLTWILAERYAKVEGGEDVDLLSIRIAAFVCVNYEFESRDGVCDP
jgi:hypothetical protein